MCGLDFRDGALAIESRCMDAKTRIALDHGCEFRMDIIHSESACKYPINSCSHVSSA